MTTGPYEDKNGSENKTTTANDLVTSSVQVDVGKKTKTDAGVSGHQTGVPIVDSPRVCADRPIDGSDCFLTRSAIHARYGPGVTMTQSKKTTLLLLIVIALLVYAIAISFENRARRQTVEALKPEALKTWHRCVRVASSLSSFEHYIDTPGNAKLIDELMHTDQQIEFCLDAFQRSVPLHDRECLFQPTNECRLDFIKRTRAAMPERYSGPIPEELK